jgi:hypothetical protein
MKPCSLALALVVALGVQAGCSKRDSGKVMTLEVPDGKLKVQTDESGSGTGKMTIDTADGKAVVEGDKGGMRVTSTGKDGKPQTSEMTGKVDLAAFEGMVYPGAEPEADGGFASMKSGAVSTVTGTFATADSPEKLVEHYKKLLPDATFMTSGTMTSISGKNAKGANVSISIVGPEGPGKTKVTVAVTHSD